MTSDDEPSPMNVQGHTSTAWTAADRRAAGGDARERRGAAQRRQEDRHPRRAGGPGRRRRAGAGWPTCWARRSSRPLLGKAVVPDDSPVHHRRHRPAGDAALREGDGGVRQPADGRHELPLHGSTSRARPGAGPCRSTATRRGSACATRSTSAWPATPGRRSQALLPLLQRRQDRSFLEKAQERMKEWWELMRDARGPRRRRR